MSCGQSSFAIARAALKFQEGGRKAHVFAFVSAICKIVSDIVRC